MHVLFRLTHGKTADRVTIEADLQQAVQRHIPQRFVDGTLDDAEQGVLVAECIELWRGSAWPSAGTSPWTCAPPRRWPGTGVHSSKIITMSEPRSYWISMDFSGSRKIFSPLMG